MRTTSVRRHTGATSPRRRATAVLLGAALALAACGDQEAAEADPPDPETGDAAANQAEAGEGDQENGEHADEVADAPTLEAQDGWLDLHDLPLPAPGTAELSVAGEEIDLEVECSRPGPLDDHGYLLFGFTFTGDGETSDGQSVSVSGSRELVDEEEAAKSVYDYAGQERGSFQIDLHDGERFHIAIAVSPADDDPGGTQLPILHIDESGGFTVDQEVPAFGSGHGDALAGHVTLAGQCQEDWPDDRG
jgi:hypothetical protein